MEQIFNEEGKAAGRLVAVNDERATFKRRISWKEGPRGLDACRRTAEPCEQSLAEHSVVWKPPQV